MTLRHHRIPLLVLVLSTLVVYALSLDHDFIPQMDDSAYVLANPAVRGITFQNIRTAFSTYFVGNYAPLHIVSYMIDYTVWGLRPSGFILTNLILHTMNGMLFYMLLIRSSFTRSISCAAAVFFLLHPVQVESVVWISERKTVLAMFFFLVAFHFYLRYRESEEDGRRSYLLSLLFFVMAILSKSVAVILPAALLIHDAGRDGEGRHGVSFLDKIPYAVVALAGALLAYLSQDPAHAGGRVCYHGGSPLATFLSMLPVLQQYLKLLLWPLNLGTAYPVEIHTGFDEDVALAGLVAGTLLGIGCYLFRRSRKLFTWYAFFFLGLLPVSQIIPICTLINDRYLYFPLLGAAPFLCASLIGLGRILPGTKLVLNLLLVVIISGIAFLTFRRAEVWRDSLTVWNDVVRMTPDNRFAWQILLYEYTRRQDRAGALQTSLRMLAYFPDDKTALEMAHALSNGKGYQRSDGQ